MTVAGRTVLAASLALGAGVAIGALVARRSPSASGGSPVEAAADRRADTGSDCASLAAAVAAFREEARAASSDLARQTAALRDEVRALGLERSSPEQAKPAAAADPANAAEARAALEPALARVRERLQAGVWRAEDRDQLHQLLPLLAEPQQREIFTALLPAINEGRLSVAEEITGPPF